VNVVFRRSATVFAINDDAPADYAFEIAALSDVGTGRDHNEDSCATFMESASVGIAAVADGVSSSAAGETASTLALEVLLRCYREGTSLAPAKRLRKAVQQANIEVYDLAVVVPELRGMATTLTALAIERGQLTVAHVGDCRLYLARSGQLTQLTKDHTVAAERTRLGLLSELRARTHPGRSTLTRSVGRELIAAIDTLTTSLLEGDSLILCSDGLYNVLSDEQLRDIVARCGPDVGVACRELVDVANRRGTPDNVSVVVAHMCGTIPPPRRWFGRRSG
jgi:serine/threonine protein phosphatase PrpC